MHFFERRFSYLGGFGLPITVATLGCSFVTAAALYALLFPLLLLLAVKATPKDHKDPVCAFGPLMPDPPFPNPQLVQRCLGWCQVGKKKKRKEKQ
jgi:hypothetical protein